MFSNIHSFNQFLSVGGPHNFICEKKKSKYTIPVRIYFRNTPSKMRPYNVVEFEI